MNQGIEDYTEDQMYHIPLNKRGIISTQRYSFPGLPCLYAGASVYTCWVELNRPSFEYFQVATICPSADAQKMKVFDLSNIPQRLPYLINKECYDENEYLCYWPLMALCSIKTNKEDDVFKPEYIFPQFLLEYILKGKKNYVGIKYPSIKVATISKKQLENDWHTYVNYVFPARSDCMNGKRCKVLDNWFHIGSNKSGKELLILSDLLSVDSAKFKLRSQDEAEQQKERIARELKSRKLFTKDSTSYPYYDSRFGMIELALQLDNYNFDEQSAIQPVLVHEW